MISLNLRPGCVIVGKYRLERELASGGMGSLWVAFDRKLRRNVAVKFINSIAARHDDARMRFEREARAVAHIKSPHVVQTHDYGVDRGHAYMVMELLEGEDLGARLARERCLGVTAVSKLLDQIAKGLDAVHAAGVVHRDLKPANIFLAQVAGEETVKLIDFGVARSEVIDGGRRTDRGVLIGTLKYMAPEQALCEEGLDYRADLWSLAVIVYCLLTGKGPFSGSTREEMVLSICRDVVAPPSRHITGLPPEVDTFFERAFARAPIDRFQSAGQMATAFAAAIKTGRTKTLPWGLRPPRVLARISRPTLPCAAPAEKTALVRKGTSSMPAKRESKAAVQTETDFQLPSGILPSTYTPPRRSFSSSPSSSESSRPSRASWWWASVPVALAVVLGVVLGIAGGKIEPQPAPSPGTTASTAMMPTPSLLHGR